MIEEFVQNSPRIAIIIAAFIFTLFITIVNYFMIDKEKMKEIKERQKKLKKELKDAKHDPKKAMEINQKMMEDIPEQLKQSFRPLLITMIPLIILFSWLRSTFAETVIASTWLWWYIGASIIFSLILRKIFGLQ
ncbi:DUF106 domain-containing protein [Candidatus Pacearchaeota archaeon]|nr:DUF106 domain-containing protein [Candidatus Pacearchaeota archaeon]MBD3282784.1 DUF106 domain-containing protein [Candidatus Pacearchaeota archaeon]